jgi:holo-[acyl-carrier protein] synthase
MDANPNLGSELFTDQELAYCKTQTSADQHLAARFCAKEATAKALGLNGFDPREIEIIEGAERTRVELHGNARKRAEVLGVEISVSLTHLPSMAAAVALALPRNIRRLGGGENLMIPDESTP